MSLSLNMDASKQFSGTIYNRTYYDKAFTEIEQLPGTLSPDEIETEIRKRLNMTMLLALSLDQPTIDRLELYRLRVPKTGEKINENEISSYSYPPDKSMVKSKGRANIENQQVFYASADAHTPFHEVHEEIEGGSTVGYLSIWGVRNCPAPVFMRTLFLGIPEDQDNYSSIMAKGLYESLQKMLSTLPEPQREDYIYSQKRYAELFTAVSHKFYHISSAIANDTFVNAYKQNVNIPILAYPSVAKDKTAVNFAVRKDFVDKYIYPKEVFKVLIKEISKEKVETTIISKGIVDGDRINWLTPKMSIKYGHAFVSQDDNPKNMRNLKPNEHFTVCCNEHKLDTNQLLEKMKITESTLLDVITKIPMRLNYEGAQAFDCLVPVPVNFELYLNTDITEAGKIKYLMLPVKCSFDYINEIIK